MNSLLSSRQIGDLSEAVAAVALGGHCMPNCNPGYDVEAPDYGRVEVRARVLGTDGPRPRVSVSPTKIDLADVILAVRWTSEGHLDSAFANNVNAIKPLFSKRLQRSGRIAHISWSSWIACPGCQDLTESMRQALRTHFT